LEPEGRRLAVKPGVSIMEALIDAGVQVEADCGGRGSCGKCRVIIVNQSGVSGITEAERRHLTEEQLSQGYRLACQTILLGDATIYFRRVRGERRIQEVGIERPVNLDPLVKKYVVNLRSPVLGNVVADADNLIKALSLQTGVSLDSICLSVARRLPKVLREAGWNVTATVWNRSLISVEDGDKRGSCYGLAIDIGTSKIVLQLVDLSTGTTIGVESAENPQIIRGEDIYTRMAYGLDDVRKSEELSRLLTQGINTLISEVCRKTGVDRDNIYEATVVGNTAMHHFFLGLPTRSLALSPFVPVVSGGLNISPSDVGLDINPEANIYVFPVIAGFVGGDCVADILSTGIYESENTSLLVDIGTNTEICLGDKNGLICCSCASGPAFEGYHITHGIKAVTGAIERVEVDRKTLKADYSTVGGAKPLGICGSGMIDILAEMRRLQIITNDGRLNGSCSRIKTWAGAPAFIVADATDTATGEDIVVTQKDIRELQLAKAAIITGCRALMLEKKVSVEDIDVVYVAGAFGNYLNIRNAVEIGMLPPVSEDRFRIVGNAAIVGAKLGLISSLMRKKAEEIAKNTQYVELGARPTFNQEFTSALKFP
jgi:uncharacterized 2Fe-2S/4Fe-4S cluster protein (DUF4445 family)